MITSTQHADYQKLMKKGNGSILKAIRTDKGGGKGLIAGGMVLIGAALVFSLFGGLLFFGIPGVLLLVIGLVLKNKREGAWISYYQEESGYSESELRQADRELASPSAALVVTSASTTGNSIACIFTEHYMLMNGVSPYVRRLEDFIAAAFSDSTDNWCMASLTTRDKETKSIALFTDSAKKPELCNEIISELHRRNPKVLCGQAIVCEDRHYILERDGAEILRLYQEGRKLEPAE